jgi:hypothetical protein
MKGNLIAVQNLAEGYNAFGEIKSAGATIKSLLTKFFNLAIRAGICVNRICLGSGS